MKTSDLNLAHRHGLMAYGTWDEHFEWLHQDLDDLLSAVDRLHGMVSGADSDADAVCALAEERFLGAVRNLRGLKDRMLNERASAGAVVATREALRCELTRPTLSMKATKSRKGPRGA